MGIKNFLKDRFTIGFIAGLLAAIPLNIIDYIFVYLFKLEQSSYMDYAAVILFGHMHHNIGEAILAQFSQLLFSGILGIFYFYLLKTELEKNHLLKGWVFAMGAWFFIYSIGTIFKVPVIYKAELGTLVSDFVSVTVFGLLLADFVKKLKLWTNIS